MRIVILGDFHLTPSQREIADLAMEDINSIQPDLVVPLGDFGAGGGKIGSPAGLAEAWEHLGELNAPLRPILGNHDLQEESSGKRAHGSMAKALQKICNDATGHGFMEFEKFRFLFISTDPQPADSCWQVQECYVSPQNFQKIRRGIEERPGVPIVVFSHAPPIGCGLRTVQTVHVRATNAYLDQNHDPRRWEALYREHKEIVLWFSAHYHLGHDHPDSVSNVLGTHFFQTQIHGLQTRDETRQSRVLDIAEGSVTVSTLDHIARKQTAKSQWHTDQSLGELMDSKAEALTGGREPELRIPLSDAPLPGCFRRLNEDRFLIGTAEGRLWEVEIPTRSVLGTWHAGPPLSGVIVTEKRVWRAWQNQVISQPKDTLARFIRVGEPKTLPGRRYEIEENISALIGTESKIFALGSQHLWEYSLKEDRFIRSDSLPASAAPGKAGFWQNSLVFSSEEGELWRRKNPQEWELLDEDVLFWSSNGEELAVAKEGKLSIYGADGHTDFAPPMAFDEGGLAAPLPGGNWLFSTTSGLWELRSGEFSQRREASSPLFSAILPAKDGGGIEVGINYQNQLVSL